MSISQRKCVVKVGWDGDFPEEVTFAHSEGRVNIFQTWKIMGGEGSIINNKTCSDPMGRGGGSEQWCIDGSLREIVIEGATSLYRRATS